MPLQPVPPHAARVAPCDGPDGPGALRSEQDLQAAGRVAGLLEGGGGIVEGELVGRQRRQIDPLGVGRLTIDSTTATAVSTNMPTPGINASIVMVLSSISAR